MPINTKTPHVILRDSYQVWLRTTSCLRTKSAPLNQSRQNQMTQEQTAQRKKAPPAQQALAAQHYSTKFYGLTTS